MSLIKTPCGANSSGVQLFSVQRMSGITLSHNSFLRVEFVFVHIGKSLTDCD